MRIRIPTLNFWNQRIIKTEMLDQLLPLPFLLVTVCLLQMLGTPELLYAGVEMVRLVAACFCIINTNYVISCLQCIIYTVSHEFDFLKPEEIIIVMVVKWFWKFLYDVIGSPIIFCLILTIIVSPLRCFVSKWTLKDYFCIICGWNIKGVDSVLIV